MLIWAAEADVSDMERLQESIGAALHNARRLLEDADYLRFAEPPATAYYLALIAQEECAKAFLLALARRRIVPWDQHILRATRDHACKQLTCVVMEYVTPELDEFLERCDAIHIHDLPALPRRVADAMNILRHEKIGRWVSRSWFWAEEPEYDSGALRIAEGRHDARKQDALYVRLSSDASLASVPSVAVLELDAEIERAARFAGLVDRLLEDEAYPGLDWDMIEAALRALFTDPIAAEAG